MAPEEQPPLPSPLDTDQAKIACDRRCSRTPTTPVAWYRPPIKPFPTIHAGIYPGHFQAYQWQLQTALADSFSRLFPYPNPIDTSILAANFPILIIACRFTPNLPLVGVHLVCSGFSTG